MAENIEQGDAVDRTFGEQLREETTGPGEAVIKKGRKRKNGAAVGDGDGFEIPPDPKPAKSKGKAKAKKAKGGDDDDEAGVGHNGGSIDETRALKTQFHCELRALEDQIQHLTGKRRDLIKKAKSRGINTKSILDRQKELKMGRLEMIDEHNVAQEDRAMFGLPHARPITQRKGEAGDLETAEQRGRSAAYRGSPASIIEMEGYDPGLPAGQSWLHGHASAMAIISDVLPASTLNRFVKTTPTPAG